MLAIFNRLFGMKQTAPAATVIDHIDQQAHFDELKRRHKRRLDDEREREADRDRIAVIVWTRARDCVTFGEQRRCGSVGDQVVDLWAGGSRGHCTGLRQRPPDPQPRVWQGANRRTACRPTAAAPARAAFPKATGGPHCWPQENGVMKFTDVEEITSRISRHAPSRSKFR